MQSASMNMHRKPGFPVANCTIKMPDGVGVSEPGAYEDENEQQQRRQQLINFGHSQWGFNNWSWAVTKQELDFVELTNGKYCAGVVAFVSVTLKSFDIHRENIGYATSSANTKGFAIYKSRKCAVTNALRETLLSFGGSVAADLMELSDGQRTELPTAPHVPPVPPDAENNQNVANMTNKIEPMNMKNVVKKEENVAQNMKGIHLVKNNPNPNQKPVANAPRSPPVARAQPMPCPVAAARAPAPLPPPPRAAPQHPRPNSNDCKLEGMTEEEARAERKRRQKLAQEEFRQKQLLKNNNDEKPDPCKNSSSMDQLMMEIPTQDIQEIQETGQSARPEKRASPAPEGSAKRRASFSKLDIVTTD